MLHESDIDSKTYKNNIDLLDNRIKNLVLKGIIFKL